MKRLFAAAAVVAIAALALPVSIAGTAGAAKGGNSSNDVCQKGGWQTWTGNDARTFKNQGDCVSYAAQTPSPAELLCVAWGGTFGRADRTYMDWDSIDWTCNGWEGSAVADEPDFWQLKAFFLAAACNPHHLDGSITDSIPINHVRLNSTCGVLET